MLPSPALTSPPLEREARALTLAASAAPARSRPPAPRASSGPSLARPAPATPDLPGAPLAPWWHLDPSPEDCTSSPSRACSSAQVGANLRPQSLRPQSITSPPPQARRGWGGLEDATTYPGAWAPWTARSPWRMPGCACARPRPAGKCSSGWALSTAGTWEGGSSLAKQGQKEELGRGLRAHVPSPAGSSPAHSEPVPLLGQGLHQSECHFPPQWNGEMVNYHIGLRWKWNDTADLKGGSGCEMLPELWSQKYLNPANTLSKSLGMTKCQFLILNGDNTIYFTSLVWELNYIIYLKHRAHNGHLFLCFS